MMWRRRGWSRFPLPVCDGFELPPCLPHGNLCGGTGRPAGELPLEPAPVASGQMLLPLVQEMDQKPIPETSEQMPLPAAAGKK